MAFASLFTLLDDVTTVLDDVAAMTKVAAKKTAGLVGDDLAVNANQLTGIAAKRELPVIWEVTKGSFKNKAVIIPAALLISYFFPILITILLMIGGAYLSFEGMEKVIHHVKGRREAHQLEPNVENHSLGKTHTETEVDSTNDERTKINGAIRTDFILSAEIIIIAMGVVATMSILPKTMVMIAIGVGITVLVYGFVSLIIKLDDMGLWLMQKESRYYKRLGRGMIAFMPHLMRGLAIIGTIAMFLVGGGIFTHNWPWLHGLIASLSIDSTFLTMLIDLFLGMLVGMAVYLLVLPFMNLKRAEPSRLTLEQ